MNKVTCPKCSDEFEVAPAACVPDEQRLVLALTLESDYCAAETIASLLKATVTTLKAVAKNLGTKVTVFIDGMKMEDRKIEISLFICGNKTK